MYGMSASNMHKLQSAQNSLTRVVLPSLRHLSASERHSYLHWLPVHYRIQFKIATFTYKTLATCQPSYLYSLIQLHQPSRALRSSTQHLYAKYHICLPISVSPHSPAHNTLRLATWQLACAFDSCLMCDYVRVINFCIIIIIIIIIIGA